MLFESSEESPGVRGFGFFGGEVKRFATPGLKVPQIGWNQLELTDRANPLWRGLPEHPHVYFVHSYFPSPSDASIVTSRSTYGETFAAAPRAATSRRAISPGKEPGGRPRHPAQLHRERARRPWLVD